ncbi:LexA family protein [Streptomyces sp. NPDC127108]|uniref:LexA family protein n=1 Tax=Streptomyces sp. NPDC127108 TaxID=3345361 RepID=UPI00363F69DB
MPRAAVGHGELFALTDDGEATIKKLHLDGGEAWLWPCNLAFPPLRLPDMARSPGPPAG